MISLKTWESAPALEISQVIMGKKVYYFFDLSASGILLVHTDANLANLIRHEVKYS